MITRKHTYTIPIPDGTVKAVDIDIDLKISLKMDEEEDTKAQDITIHLYPSISHTKEAHHQ